MTRSKGGRSASITGAITSWPSVAATRRRWQRIDPVLLLTIALGLGAALLALAHVDAVAVSGSRRIPWWVLATAFFAVEACKVHLRVRRETHSLSLNEIPLVVALAFVSPATLFLARGLGSLVAYVFYWRQTGAKLAFNLTRLAAETGLALTVYRVMLDGHDPLGPRGWVAALVAMIAVDVFAGVVITMVLATRGGRSEWSGTPGVIGVGVLAAGATTSVALVGTLLLADQALAVTLLGVLAVLLLLAYKAHVALAAGHSSLSVLHDFTQAVSRSVREQDVVATTLHEARSLLRAETAELLLPRSGGYRRIIADETGIRRERLPPDGVPACFAGPLQGEVLRATRGTRHRAERQLLSDSGRRDLLAVPLRSEDAIVGVLLVANRVDEVSTFDADDQRLLETLANSASVALQNGRLVEQLLEEAAEKERRALRDTLTGLPNRAGLGRRLAESLSDARNRTAVLHLMFDGIGEVRDAVGHETGDALLCGVAQRLSQLLPADAVLGRLSGDEFAAILADATTAADVAALVVSRFGPPVRVATLEIPVTARAGVAVPGGQHADPVVLLQHAEAAVLAAREQRRPVHVHTPGPEDQARRRLALVDDLTEAIHTSRIDVVYQPQVSFATSGVVGVEALARWQHSELGAISPQEFVALAESTGLIRRLTLHVLSTALKQCATWRSGGLDLRVAVNLSMRSLHELSLCDNVAQLLVDWGVPASSLVLEITEGSVMTRPEETVAVLDRLREIGVSLSIDDFGTGYSSLSYLSRLPVHELKIDKEFVLGLAGSADKTAIVRATIALAHDLGLTVVAEGVEDVESWRALTGLGCDVAQGYLLSRPLEANDLLEWVRRRTLTIPAQPDRRRQARAQ